MDTMILRTAITNLDFEYGFSKEDTETIIQNVLNITSNECIDEWGFICYGNDTMAVDYNLCLDYTTDEIENCSAFYRIVNGEHGWSHDDCSRFYHYEIDFTNPNWRIELEAAARKAFRILYTEEEQEKPKSEEKHIKILNAATVICKECPATGAPGYDCEHCIVREIVNNTTI